MSENTLRVPFDGKAPEHATLLLAAAQELGYDANVVTTDTSAPGPAFHAPADVVEKAFGKGHGYDQSGSYAQTEQATAVEQADVPSDLPDNVTTGEVGTPIEQPPAGDQAPPAEKPVAKKAPAKKAPAKKAAAKRPAKKAAAKKTAAKKG